MTVEQVTWPQLPTRARAGISSGAGLLAAALVALCLGTFTANWLAAAAILVLWAVWWQLPNDDGLHVLAFALTFQWLQVTIGIFYFLLTGRQVPTMYLSPYQPMVLAGLGCVLSLIGGIRVGAWLLRRRRTSTPRASGGWFDLPFSTGGLVTLYALCLALEGSITRLAFTIPVLTQPILIFRYAHLGALFLLLRRLSRSTSNWPYMAVLLALEVAVGLTGFFAGYREPLVIAAMVLAGAFDLRKSRHWLTAAVLMLALAGISLLWVSVRREYRREFNNPGVAASREARFERITSLSADWLDSDAYEIKEDTDRLIDRIWAVYYPALAVSRVPAVLPHTDGRILKAAIVHALEPRVFFPEKADLQSDSVMVNRYSGVRVAGAAEGTSIAFGYAAEGYLDFGIPGMFVPVILWGLFLGAAYAFLLRAIRCRELAVATVSVIFWVSLYLFERSWVREIGYSGTMLIYLGGAALLLDRWLHSHMVRRMSAVGPKQRSAPAVARRA